MQYQFTPDELTTLLAKTLARFVASDGVYDFSEGHTAQQETVTAVMADLALSYEAMPAIQPESWIDKMIAEEVQADFTQFNAYNDEMMANLIARRNEAIPFMGEPIPYETDNDVSPSELGLVKGVDY